MNDFAPPQFDGTMETRPTWLQKKSHSGKVDMTSADFVGGRGEITRNRKRQLRVDYTAAEDVRRTCKIR